jgi:uncharacterized membrane protein
VRILKWVFRDTLNNVLSNESQIEVKIPVNENAPVISAGRIEINAPISDVWNVLTSIESWPTWQADVTDAKLNGEVAEGTTFVWKAGGLTFNSRLHTVLHLEELGWTGTTFGASAIHNWTFSETEGHTMVGVRESLQGIFPSIFKKYFQKTLDAGIVKNLEELKKASESKK